MGLGGKWCLQESKEYKLLRVLEPRASMLLEVLCELSLLKIKISHVDTVFTEQVPLLKLVLYNYLFTIYKHF